MTLGSSPPQQRLAWVLGREEFPVRNNGEVRIGDLVSKSGGRTNEWSNGFCLEGGNRHNS